MSDPQENNPAPELPDEEIEAELTPPEFAWETFAESAEECRRAFVLSTLGSSDFNGELMLSNIHLATEWLRTGILPVQSLRGRK